MERPRGPRHPRRATRLRIVQADVRNLPFAANTFDYALTAMFLHHLDDDDVVRVFAAMNRVARRGIVAADLLRNRRAYAWIRIFTLFANDMVKHDARVSVAQAFRRREILDLRDRAGIGFAQYHKHFAHRFVLAGEKPVGAHRGTFDEPGTITRGIKRDSPPRFR